MIMFSGVGKTTLIRKICSNLRDKGHLLQGFYTEEVRGEGISQRIGFDVVTLAGKRGILSRENPEDKLRRPKVGKYSVFVQNFEDLALPLLVAIRILRQILQIGLGHYSAAFVYNF